MAKNQSAQSGQALQFHPVTQEEIREHNRKVGDLIHSFALLRDIEERRLLSAHEITADLMTEAMQANIRKAQQDVWMYGGIMQKLEELYLTPALKNGGAS